MCVYNIYNSYMFWISFNNSDFESIDSQYQIRSKQECTKLEKCYIHKSSFEIFDFFNFSFVFAFIFFLFVFSMMHNFIDRSIQEISFHKHKTRTHVTIFTLKPYKRSFFNFLLIKKEKDVTINIFRLLLFIQWAAFKI